MLSSTYLVDKQRLAKNLISQAQELTRVGRHRESVVQFELALREMKGSVLEGTKLH
jgi:hypothetical protein